MKNKGFSRKEISYLHGHLRRLARKHKVSDTYVRYIAYGIKPVNSPKAKAIYKDIKTLIKALAPVFQ